MIEVSHVSKAFEGVTALDNLSLTVPTGSIYGLVGPNGAGKSTLIRHISGVYEPDSGTITVAGHEPFNNPHVKAQIQCVYDEVYHYSHATLGDLKALYQRLYPAFSEERFQALGTAFPQVSESALLRRMSRGMAKQAALWLALSCQPDVLLLDEPLDGLDPVIRRQVWSLLAADVAEREMTVLLSSHNLRELEDICDHVGVLNHGSVLLERNIGELQDNVSKVQVLFDGEAPELPSKLAVLHESAQGQLHTYIVRNAPHEVHDILQRLHPIYLETLPLTLEEIFIYELEGADYAVHDILL